jgi:hypothetical protein
MGAWDPRPALRSDLGYRISPFQGLGQDANAGHWVVRVGTLLKRDTDIGTGHERVRPGLGFGPSSGLRRSNRMSPAVIFGRQRLTADNCPVRTLSRKEGTAGGTGLGRWDGTSCFTEKSPEKSAPSPRPSPGGLGEGERWDGIGSGRDTSDGECVAERKTIADDDLLVVGIRARIRGKGSPPPAASPSGRSRSGSDIVPAGDGTHPLGRDQSHATVVARSRRHKTADPCPAPGSRASAPAGSAHLRNYSEALHRFRTAMSKNSDDKKDCPPPESSGLGGRM